MDTPQAAHDRDIAWRIGRQVRSLLAVPDALTDDELAWADLFDHGLTSKEALVLVAWLKDEFGVDVQPRVVWGDPYVAALTELVASGGNG
ncbi:MULTISPECIES: acyl carrier protein [Streptomyces]|uniref:acyl carrier protein n=1 Tax=Streptomyces TaxID=1883 RepID=UPI0004CD63AF|nr:acyl carrier protein [Streptomyces durhamensis]